MIEQWWGDALRPAIARLNSGHYLSTTIVLAQVYTPLAALIIARGLSRLHHAGLEAAQFYFRGLRLVVWVATAVQREIAAALLLIFALGLGSFAVPHVLQCELYSLEVYTRMANYLDERGAVQAAAPLLILALAAAALAALFEDRGSAASPLPQRAMRVKSIRGAAASHLVLGAWVAVVVLLPVAALVRECSSPARFLAAVRDAAPETENTLAIALAAAGLAALAGLASGVWAWRSNRRWIGALVMAPLGVPPLILGLAYLRAFNRSWPVDLTVVGSTSLLIVLGLAARGWSFVTRIVTLGCRRVAPQWLEAAALSNLKGWREVRFVTGPLLAGPLATGAMIAFVLAAAEVEISQMLSAPGSGTLALRLFTFLHFGPSYVAASLALLQLIVVATPVLVYFLLANRSPEIV
jgi:ABC-type Fe3+ transport system permease subunit